MKIFSKLYNIVVSWAAKKYAVFYLLGLSFFESFILPYPPPDVLLAPMVLNKPNQAYKLAFFTTIFSVLGGVVGYILGYFFFDLVYPFIDSFNYEDGFSRAKFWFNEYGLLIIFIAGFSPIPYKIFTIAAGVMSMALLPFIIISVFARGIRFLLVSFIVKKYGSKCDTFLRQYIDYIGYTIILLAILFIFFSK